MTMASSSGGMPRSRRACDTGWASICARAPVAAREERAPPARCPTVVGVDANGAMPGSGAASAVQETRSTDRRASPAGAARRRSGMHGQVLVCIQPGGRVRPVARGPSGPASLLLEGDPYRDVGLDMSHRALLLVERPARGCAAAGRTAVRAARPLSPSMVAGRPPAVVACAAALRDAPAAQAIARRTVGVVRPQPPRARRRAAHGRRSSAGSPVATLGSPLAGSWHRKAPRAR